MNYEFIYYLIFYIKSFSFKINIGYILYILIFKLLSLLYKSNNKINSIDLSDEEATYENLLSFILIKSLNVGSV